MTNSNRNNSDCGCGASPKDSASRRHRLERIERILDRLAQRDEITAIRID